MITYEQAKDEVAKGYGWETAKEFEENESRASVINHLCKEAAELYANSKVEERDKELSLITQELVSKGVELREQQKAMYELSQHLKKMTTVATIYREEVEEYKRAMSELAEQLELMTKAAEIFEAKLNNCEEEKKSVWDRACEAYEEKLSDDNRLGLKHKPEYKP